MVDYLSRFAVPGQDLTVRIRDGDRTDVVDPRPCNLSNPAVCFSRATGPDTVRTFFINSDHTAIRNETLPNHILHDGVIEREIVQIGSTWYIFTHGYGNNQTFPINITTDQNQVQGPKIFDYVDQQMKDYIKNEKEGSQ